MTFTKKSAAMLGIVVLSGAGMALVPFVAGESAQAHAAQDAPLEISAAQDAEQAPVEAAIYVVAAIEPHAEADSELAEMDDELLCLAKVVYHESANQPIKGQLAVAQVVMNRLKSPRFPGTICNVVMQRGQFFNVKAYNPPEEDKRWPVAIEVARDARAGVSEQVVGKALFFRAAQINPPFFQSRPIVSRIGNHYFHL